MIMKKLMKLKNLKKVIYASYVIVILKKALFIHVDICVHAINAQFYFFEINKRCPRCNSISEAIVPKIYEQFY